MAGPAIRRSGFKRPTRLTVACSESPDCKSWRNRAPRHPRLPRARRADRWWSSRRRTASRCTSLRRRRRLHRSPPARDHISDPRLIAAAGDHRCRRHSSGLWFSRRECGFARSDGGNIAFIGPTAANPRVGDKAARKAMTAVGVPIIPGTGPSGCRRALATRRRWASGHQGCAGGGNEAWRGRRGVRAVVPARAGGAVCIHNGDVYVEASRVRGAIEFRCWATSSATYDPSVSATAQCSDAAKLIEKVRARYDARSAKRMGDAAVWRQGDHCVGAGTIGCCSTRTGRSTSWR